MQNRNIFGCWRDNRVADVVGKECVNREVEMSSGRLEESRS